MKAILFTIPMGIFSIGMALNLSLWFLSRAQGPLDQIVSVCISIFAGYLIWLGAQKFFNVS